VKTTIIRSSWLGGYSYRLDTKPYVSGALEAKIILEQLPLRKDPLSTLTKGFDGGIYNGPQFVRNYLKSPDEGVPFMTGSTMQLADLSNLPFLSKRDAHGPKLKHLELQPGMSLISCSGSIGKMAYARTEMKGIWASQDILKVVADPQKIPSGYLYSYLCSKFGVPLLVSGTYGSIIQHLEAHQIAGLPVPRLGNTLEHEIHELVEQSAKLRTKASKQIREAKELFLTRSGHPPQFGDRLAGDIVSQTSSNEILTAKRFDPWFFNAKAVAIDRWIRSHSWGFRELVEVANVYNTSPFKRAYVENLDHGVGFFGSADIFKVDRTPESFISRTATKNIDDYLLPEGAVLLASSGSLGGVIGRPQFVDSAMAGQAASNHVMRIVSTSDDIPPGFLYAYLSTQEIGYPLLLRTATGDAIPEVWPVFVNRIPILQAPKQLVREIDKVIRVAFEARVKATEFEQQARDRLEAALKESTN
jgi:type I restriction enzyme S subunit